MSRPKLLQKIIYAGVVVLCIVICWNASLLYRPTSKDGDTEPTNHAQLVKQRDTLFDTIGMLKQTCSDGDHGRKRGPGRNSESDGTVRIWTKPSEVDLRKSLVLGNRKEKKGFLTIGIPTVQRESEHYLTQTLDSLIENSTPEEQAEVTLFIFLADFEEEKRMVLKNLLMDRYLSHLESGFMQVIQAPQGFYPPLDNLKLLFGDSKERVYWRSKQCVDFAFMFYADSFSEYYIQIEDDVVTTTGYISAIREYVQSKRSTDWITLEFSVLGFIGKLFHAYDLDRLAQFIMFFYQEQPVDFLYRYFNSLNGQQETHQRLPSLFQHKGKQSSLKDKESHLEDNFFDLDKRQYTDSNNPPANVYSDMKQFSMYLGPQLSYSIEPGYFWAVSPQEGQSVVVVFDDPTVLSRIAIATGSDKNPADMLEVAALELSSTLLQSGSEETLPECSSYVEMGRFVKGSIDINVQEKFTETVACLRIHVLVSQVQWGVIREIAVWIHR